MTGYLRERKTLGSASKRFSNLLSIEISPASRILRYPARSTSGPKRSETEPAGQKPVGREVGGRRGGDRLGDVPDRIGDPHVADRRERARQRVAAPPLEIGELAQELFPEGGAPRVDDAPPDLLDPAVDIGRDLLETCPDLVNFGPGLIVVNGRPKGIGRLAGRVVSRRGPGGKRGAR